MKFISFLELVKNIGEWSKCDSFRNCSIMESSAYSLNVLQFVWRLQAEVRFVVWRSPKWQECYFLLCGQMNSMKMLCCLGQEMLVEDTCSRRLRSAETSSPWRLTWSACLLLLLQPDDAIHQYGSVAWAALLQDLLLLLLQHWCYSLQYGWAEIVKTATHSRISLHAVYITSAFHCTLI